MDYSIYRTDGTIAITVPISNSYVQTEQERFDHAFKCLINSGKNLKNLNLEGLDLTDYAFEDFNLKGSSFKNSILIQTTFKYCNLKQCNFYNVNGTGVTFEDCTLNKSNFNQAKIQQSGFLNSQLHDCLFEYTNILDINLQGSSFSCDQFYFSKNAPLIIGGLRWLVIISGTGWLTIGCQKKSIKEWLLLNSKQVDNLSIGASEFYNKHVEMIKHLCLTYKHEVK